MQLLYLKSAFYITMHGWFTPVFGAESPARKGCVLPWDERERHEAETKCEPTCTFWKAEGGFTRDRVPNVGRTQWQTARSNLGVMLK